MSTLSLQIAEKKSQPGPSPWESIHHAELGQELNLGHELQLDLSSRRVSSSYPIQRFLVVNQ